MYSIEKVDGILSRTYLLKQRQEINDKISEIDRQEIWQLFLQSQIVESMILHYSDEYLEFWQDNTLILYKYAYIHLYNRILIMVSNQITNASLLGHML
jgi:hypothetical protein